MAKVMGKTTETAATCVTKDVRIRVSTNNPIKIPKFPHKPNNPVTLSATVTAAPESISARLKVRDATRMISSSRSRCRFKSAIPSKPSNPNAEVINNTPVNRTNTTTSTNTIKKKHNKINTHRYQSINNKN